MNTPIQSAVTTTGKAVATGYHNLVNATSRGVNTVVTGVKNAYNTRVQEQKNFENRADNSNYYGTASSFKK